MNFFETIIVSLVTASLTSYVAYLLAMSKFRNEKIWLKKFESYEVLLQNLHTMMKISDAEENELMSGYGISEEGKKERNESYRAARSAFNKSLAIGPVLFSNESQEILRNFEREYAANHNQEHGDLAIIDGASIESSAFFKLGTSAQKDLSGGGLSLRIFEERQRWTS